MGRCTLVGEDSHVMLGPHRRPGIWPLSIPSMLIRFVCVGGYFSDVLVSLSNWNRGRVGHLGTRALFPEEA